MVRNLLFHKTERRRGQMRRAQHLESSQPETATALVTHSTKQAAQPTTAEKMHNLDKR